MGRGTYEFIKKLHNLYGWCATKFAPDEICNQFAKKYVVELKERLKENNRFAFALEEIAKDV